MAEDEKSLNKSHLGRATRVPSFLTQAGGHKWGRELYIRSIDTQGERERLLQVGEVRHPACNLSAYFSLPDFLPHLRGLDKLLLTVVHHPGNSYLECVVWGSLGGGNDSARLP